MHEKLFITLGPGCFNLHIGNGSVKVTLGNIVNKTCSNFTSVETIQLSLEVSSTASIRGKYYSLF